MECEYCNKTFVSKSVLIKHQKSAKYCLKIQNKNNENSEYFHECDYCKKVFTRKYLFEDHNDKCLDRYKSLLKTLEEEVCTSKNIIMKKLMKLTISSIRWRYCRQRMRCWRSSWSVRQLRLRRLRSSLKCRIRRTIIIRF